MADIALATPQATLTALAFEPHGDRALIAAWDGSLTVYDCFSSAANASSSTPRRPIARFEHPGPLLAACWGPQGSGVAFCAGADRKIRSWNVAKAEGQVLGEMDGPVSALKYSPQSDLLIAASWSSQLLLIPSPLSFPSLSARTLSLPAKPLALALTPDRLVVAMAERLVYVYTLARLRGEGGEGWDAPEQQRESALKGVTRDVEGMPDGLGWTACSVDGRIAVEYFAPADQSKKYAYKAHRVPSKPGADAGDAVFPVNALAYRPDGQAFASAGSDGAVSLWDPAARKRAKSWKFRGPVGVCAWAGGRGEWLGVGWGALEQEGQGGGEVGCVVKWIG